MRLEQVWEAGQYHWVLRDVGGLFEGTVMGKTYQEAERALRKMQQEQADRADRGLKHCVELAVAGRVAQAEAETERLVAAAAEATELFDEDELEDYARHDVITHDDMEATLFARRPRG